MTAIAMNLAPSALIPTGALAYALKLLGKTVERRNTIPILSNVALTSGPDGLAIAGTDLDMQLTARIPDAIADDGLAITLNHALLHDLVRKTAADEIGITSGLDVAKLDLGGSRSTLQTLPFDDFPALPMTSPINADITMSADDFLAALNATAFAISTEETRYYLNGIYFHIAGGKFRMVATDDHRLALHDIGEASADHQTMPGVIIPRKAVDMLQALLKPVYAAKGSAAGYKPAPPREADAIEDACRAAGWEHGGDGDGFVFHKPTWGSWKAAASWEGTDNAPSGPDAKPATYSTWAKCYANEIEEG